MPKARYRPGTWSASDMTADYDIEAFPVQDDQGVYRWWIASPSELFNEVDAVIASELTGHVIEVGSWHGSWFIAVATPDMMQHLRAALFPTNGLNEAATIVTYTATRGWVCLNLKARWKGAVPGQIAETKPRGRALLNVRIDFDSGVLAASGGEFTNEFTSEFTHGGIPD